jgi:hypothetical protein
MTWVKHQHELPTWEVLLIEEQVEECYAERASRTSRKVSS